MKRRKKIYLYMTSVLLFVYIGLIIKEDPLLLQTIF